MTKDSIIEEEVQRVWAVVGNYFTRETYWGDEFSASNIKPWAPYESKLRSLFSQYDAPDLVESRFHVPKQYKFFLQTYGGGFSDGSYEIYASQDVFSLAEADAELCAERQEDERSASSADYQVDAAYLARSPVDGYWLRIGGPEWKFDHFICCDTEHPLYGKVVRGDDSHPQWYEYSDADHDSFLDLLPTLIERDSDKKIAGWPTEPGPPLGIASHGSRERDGAPHPTYYLEVVDANGTCFPFFFDRFEGRLHFGATYDAGRRVLPGSSLQNDIFVLIQQAIFDGIDDAAYLCMILKRARRAR